MEVNGSAVSKTLRNTVENT